MHRKRARRLPVVALGTLTYEAVAQNDGPGLGQSNAVGIGAAPVLARRKRTLSIFCCFIRDDARIPTRRDDRRNRGSDEETAAHWVREHMDNARVGFIAGLTGRPASGWSRRRDHLGRAGHGSGKSSGDGLLRIRVTRIRPKSASCTKRFVNAASGSVLPQ